MLTAKFKVTFKGVTKGIENVLTASQRMQRRNNDTLAGQIRKASKNSIKKAATLSARKKAELIAAGGGVYARPGEPPLAHNGAIKNFLRYAYDPRTRSHVIGPEKLNYTGLTQRSLEMGEPTLIMQRRNGVKFFVEVPLRSRPYMRPAMQRVMTPANIKRVYENSLKQRKF